MAKYIISGSYTAEGSKGLIKEGGSSRKAAVEKMLASLDGTIESFHYAAQSPTYYLIVNLPSKLMAAAVGATIIASGAVTITDCSELLTPAEMDEAMKKSPTYRPPGQ